MFYFIMDWEAKGGSPANNHSTNEHTGFSEKYLIYEWQEWKKTLRKHTIEAAETIYNKL